MLGGDGTLCGNGLTVEPDEMADAQVVDVGVVGRFLPHEIQAEIGAVGAYGLGHLRLVQVVLQVEPRVDAVLLQQEGHLLVGIIGKRVGRRACIAFLYSCIPVFLYSCIPVFSSPCLLVFLYSRTTQVAQRLDAPQQMAYEHDATHLDDVFVEHAAVVAHHVIAEHKHDDGQHHERLPHLLVLQVGKVFAQPPPVLPHGAHHIGYEADAQQQQIAIYHRNIRLAAVDDARYYQHHERCSHHTDRPQRPLPILQHAEQQHGDQRNNRHAVEQSTHEHAHCEVFIREYGSRQVPQMPNGQDGEERYRPPSEPHGRRDLRRKGVGPSQHQVKASPRRHRRSHAVEHEQ